VKTDEIREGKHERPTHEDIEKVGAIVIKDEAQH